MSVYTVLTFLHVGLGVAALVTYWVAGVTKKGSPAHRAAGKIYLGAMAGLLIAAVPMTFYVWAARGPVTGGFLAYLLVITTTSVWSAWRAIRDKRDWARYTGPVYRMLMWLNLGSAIGVALLGLLLAQRMQLVIVAFSAIGLIGFLQMRHFVRQPPQDPRWWLNEHLSAMIGNGVATHIAFLAIGLPRLVPSLANGTWVNIAWIAPLGVAVLAGVWLRRKYLPKRAALAPLRERTTPIATPVR
jgi:hypothetical protein